MSKRTRYEPGNWNIIDDMTGFKIKASKAKLTWDGWFVNEQSWEPRNEQEFLRGIPDLQDVPTPRPEATDVFTNPISTSNYLVYANHGGGAITANGSFIIFIPVAASSSDISGG